METKISLNYEDLELVLTSTTLKVKVSDSNNLTTATNAIFGIDLRNSGYEFSENLQLNNTIVADAKRNDVATYLPLHNNKLFANICLYHMNGLDKDGQLVENTGVINNDNDIIVELSLLTVSGESQDATQIVLSELIIPAKSVEILPSTLLLNIGDTYKLKANVYPINTTNKTITWSSSDKNIVLVDNNGNIEAIDSGEVKITATSVYTNATVGSCNVNVIAAQDITPITIGDDEDLFTFNMIRVNGTIFKMGASASDENASDDEKPDHDVIITNDYYIGETEVTLLLWKNVMGENPSTVKGDTLPVIDVSYNDCQEFIAKLNQMTGKSFRLPTEAEWELAAIGGIYQAVYTYAGSNVVGDVAWKASNSENKVHPVATKQANLLGLYDMSGNVAEWCLDWYGSYSAEAQNDPTGPVSGSRRVLRGGSRMDDSVGVRVTSRSYAVPTTKNNCTGFRLALDTTTYKTGDVNGDGTVDGTDINTLINVLLGHEQDPNVIKRADVNKDGVVNGADLNELINIHLGRTNTSSIGQNDVIYEVTNGSNGLELVLKIKPERLNTTSTISELKIDLNNTPYELSSNNVTSIGNNQVIEQKNINNSKSVNIIIYTYQNSLDFDGDEYVLAHVPLNLSSNYNGTPQLAMALELPKSILDNGDNSKIQINTLSDRYRYIWAIELNKHEDYIDFANDVAAKFCIYDDFFPSVTRFLEIYYNEAKTSQNEIPKNYSKVRKVVKSDSFGDFTFEYDSEPDKSFDIFSYNTWSNKTKAEFALSLLLAFGFSSTQEFDNKNAALPCRGFVDGVGWCNRIRLYNFKMLDTSASLSGKCRETKINEEDGLAHSIGIWLFEVKNGSFSISGEVKLDIGGFNWDLNNPDGLYYMVHNASLLSGKWYRYLMPVVTIEKMNAICTYIDKDNVEDEIINI